MPERSGAGAPLPEALPAHLEFKVALLLIALALLLGVSAVYLMYARGVFSETQSLVLSTSDSDGVVPGMDLTFSGFPIGRVRRIELAADASVRIIVDVEHDNAHWLRSSSVFTLERGIVGGTRIRAFSGVLDDPPLAPGAQRELLRGDLQAEIPRLVLALRELVQNLQGATAVDSPLVATLGNLRRLSDEFGKPGGVVGALLGGEPQARNVHSLLQHTDALLARAERLLARAEQELFGNGGVTADARATAGQLDRTLRSVQKSLAGVDAVLKEAQGIASNARAATDDLAALRTEVERSLRNIDRLVEDVNRRLPFQRAPKVDLP